MFFYECNQCHKLWCIIVIILSRVPGHLHKQRVKGRLPYILLHCMEVMKLQEFSSKMVAMYISKITIMWNLNDVNMIYILFCFCASGSANVNATDKNGNNALHLCLMRRPAMMEFAKVSNTLAVTVKSVIQIYFTQTLCSWIWNACQILFSKWFWVHFLRLFWALFYFRMF